MQTKVLVISEVFYPEIGSGSVRMTNMVLKLKEKGYKVDVLTSIPKYPNQELYKEEKFRDLEKEKRLNENSEIYRVKPSKLKLSTNFFVRLYIYLFFFMRCLFKLLKINEKYDIVIVTEPSIFMGLLGIVAKLKYKCKFIFDIRDLWPECLKNVSVFKRNKIILKIGYLIEKIILFFADSIIINSEGFKEYLVNKGYKKDITFVPNGLSSDDIKRNREIIKSVNKNEKFTVIYTGMLGLPQNVRVIVKAARNLRKYDDIRFKIIGTGIQRKRVLELIEHYKLTNIEVFDAMPKEEVLKEVAKSHIALAHLRGDSAFDMVIPGKIIDYMGMGIPIVAGVEGYTSTVINESKSGIVTKPDDHIEMSEAIKSIYNSKELQSLYSKNGQTYCEMKFNWNYNIVKIDQIIIKLLRGEKSESEKSRNVRVESFYK